MSRATIAMLLSLIGLAACVADLRENYDVVVAVPVGLTSPYPNLALEEYATTIFANVYEGLVQQTRDLSFAPCLAASWETPDELTWVFRLRDDVHFHDGRALSAHHVVDAYLRGGEIDRVESGGAMRIRRISALDEQTVVIETASTVFSVGAFTMSIALEAESETSFPVGTGPYRIDSISPDGTVLLSAFSEHWAGRPRITSLEFRVVPEPEQRLALLNEGVIHLTPDVAPPEKEPHESDLTAAYGLSSPGVRVIYLGMACAPQTPDIEGVNPFSDRSVRHAVAFAIDREALVTEALAGHGEVSDQLVVRGVFGFVPGKKIQPHDPAESRRLLAEAGFPEGAVFNLDYPLGKYVNIAGIAEAVAKDLAAVGIQVRPRARSMAEMTEPDSPLWLLGWMTTTNAVSAYNYLVHTQGDGLGQINRGGYSSADIDAWLAQAGIAPPDDRFPLFESIAETLIYDMPVLPLYRQSDRYGVSQDLLFLPRPDRRIFGKELRWAQP